MTSWGFGPSGHLGGARVPGSWLMGGGERLLERVRPGVLHADLAACNAYDQGMASAARVACPALMIMGSEDKMTPARAGAKLAGAIPGAEQSVIPACGHMMLAEAGKHKNHFKEIEEDLITKSNLIRVEN